MNLYDTLGVKKDASDEDIKKAYINKAKDVHPDKEDGNTETMKDVNHAYAVLKNEDSRKRYDDTGDDDESVDNHMSELMNVVAELIGVVFNENPPNIKQLLNKIHDIWVNRYNSEARKGEQEIKKLEAFKLRILRSPEDSSDMVAIFIDNNIKTARSRLDKMKNDFEIRMEAFEYLDKYVFQTEKTADEMLHDEIMKNGNGTHTSPFASMQRPPWMKKSG